MLHSVKPADSRPLPLGTILGCLLITLAFLRLGILSPGANPTTKPAGTFSSAALTPTGLASSTAWPSNPQDNLGAEQEGNDPADPPEADAENGESDQSVIPTATSRLTIAAGWQSLRGQGPFQRPFLIELHGEIDYNTQRLIESGIQRARAAAADLVVLEVNSPGGGATESMEIADMMANITWAPTVAYISREATSGGALSALGCQYIVMQEGTTIGDIGVIQYNPMIDRFEYAPAKIRSILVAKARALNERHGRPADLGEAMVDEFAAVYRNEQQPDQFRLVSMGTPDPGNPQKQRARNDGVAPAQLDGGWSLIPETRPGRFLTLTSSRAEELGISQATVSNLGEFEKQAGVQGPWKRRTYGFTDRVVNVLNSFWVTGLLLIVGVVALFIEISAPGISVGGLIALLCFSLFFWSHFAGGTAGWLELTLFLMGVVFVLAEIFVIPGFGVAGIMGLALIGISVTMACLDFLVPETPHQWGELTWTLLTVAVSGVGGMIGIFVALQYMGDLPVLRRFTLQPPEMTETGDETTKKDGDIGAPLMVTAGRGAGLKVGDEGRSESVLRPAGRARILGRSVDVVADGRFIEPDQPVVIVDVRGNRIIVAETRSDQPATEASS